MAVSDAVAGPPARHQSRQGVVLAVASLGVMLAFIDATIVNVAFPDIRRDFDHASLNGLSWVFNAYNIVFAAFLVGAGRVADLLGRRRVFSAGLVLFTLASALCAAAPSPELLIAARVLQALGGAIVVPASLAIVVEAYPGPDRARGVALWGASAVLAAGIGPALGGVLVDLGGWRLAFLVNVPIGAAAFVLAGRVLIESRAPGRRRMPDLAGALLLAAGTALLTTYIVEGRAWGWTSAREVGAIVLGAAMLAIFGWRCTRHRAPMIDPALVSIRAVAIANATMFLAAMGYFAYLLCNVLFLTSVWHYSVLKTGLALTPGPFVAAAVARPSEGVAERVGERWVIAVGGVLWAAGVVYMAAVVGSSPRFVAEWLPGMVLLGVGAGITFPNIGSAAVVPAPGGQFATASGLNAVSRQLGAALGVATLVAIVGSPSPGGSSSVFDRGWLFAAGCFATLAVLATALGRVSAPAEEAEDLPPRRPLPARRSQRDAGAVRSDPRSRWLAPAPLSAVDALARAEVFAGARPDVLARLVSHASVTRIRAGEWLFRRGASADALYVLVAGRVEIVIEDGTVVNVQYPGSVIGELAVLSGETRSASVRARRDSRLLRLRREDFEAVMEDVPALARAINAALAQQLGRSRALIESASRPRTFALLGANDARLARTVAHHLDEALREASPVTRLDADTMPVDRAVDAIEAAEREGHIVLLVADSLDPADAWRAFCLRQADRVLLAVAAGPVDPTISGASSLRGCDLLFCGDEPGSMAPWLAALGPRRHYAVGPAGMERSVTAVARRLLGRSVGLVLSGGGARAFAQIGVIEELVAAGVQIDRVVGVSFGAFVGGLFAAGMSAEQIDGCCFDEWVRRRPLTDYGLPRHSLVRGERARNMVCRRLPGNIEDLPLEFACVAADLRAGEEVVFREGPLGDAVVASMSLPGLVPPRIIDGRLLVDGVLATGLPGHVLDDEDGPVIAVDVTLGRGERGNGSSRPPRPPRPPRVPGIGDTLFRAALFSGIHSAREARVRADLLITPDTTGVGLLEFHQLDVMREQGRRAALEALDSAAAADQLDALLV